MGFVARVVGSQAWFESRALENNSVGLPNLNLPAGHSQSSPEMVFEPGKMTTLHRCVYKFWVTWSSLTPAAADRLRRFPGTPSQERVVWGISRVAKTAAAELFR